MCGGVGGCDFNSILLLLLGIELLVIHVLRCGGAEGAEVLDFFLFYALKSHSEIFMSGESN